MSQQKLLWRDPQLSMIRTQPEFQGQGAFERKDWLIWIVACVEQWYHKLTLRLVIWWWSARALVARQFGWADNTRFHDFCYSHLPVPPQMHGLWFQPETMDMSDLQDGKVELTVLITTHMHVDDAVTCYCTVSRWKIARFVLCSFFLALIIKTYQIWKERGGLGRSIKKNMNGCLKFRSCHPLGFVSTFHHGYLWYCGYFVILYMSGTGLYLYLYSPRAWSGPLKPKKHVLWFQCLLEYI
jgi:hypothetical protein